MLLPAFPGLYYVSVLDGESGSKMLSNPAHFGGVVLVSVLAGLLYGGFLIFVIGGTLALWYWIF